MMKMTIRISARQAYRASALSLFLICAGLTYLQGAQAQVLRWEIEATVVEIDDPEMTFPDVQLGDPVRGFLSYDLSTVPDDTIPNDILYEHGPNFEVAGMVIENPRDGSEIRFLPDFSLPGLVNVINDGEDEVFGVSDSVLAAQGVVPPGGPSEIFPSVVISGLIGPAENLPDASLPLELNLEHWPDAIISYIDLVGGASIFAEIHSLTPVPEPTTLALFAASMLGILHANRNRR
jgi:hypothetical protein